MRHGNQAMFERKIQGTFIGLILIGVLFLFSDANAEHAGITLPGMQKEFTVTAMTKLVKLHNDDVQNIKIEYYLSGNATSAKLRFAGIEENINPQSGNHLSSGYNLTNFSPGSHTIELICEIGGKEYRDNATISIVSTIKQQNRVSDQVYILAKGKGWRSFYTDQRVQFWKITSSLSTTSTRFIRIASVVLHVDKNTMPVPGSFLTFLFDDCDGNELYLGQWSGEEEPPQDFSQFNLVMYCNAGIAKIRKSGGVYLDPFDGGRAPISGLTDVKIPLP